jgi:hypothetical protein
MKGTNSPTYQNDNISNIYRERGIRKLIQLNSAIELELLLCPLLGCSPIPEPLTSDQTSFFYENQTSLPNITSSAAMGHWAIRWGEERSGKVCFWTVFSPDVYLSSLFSPLQYIYTYTLYVYKFSCQKI